MADGVHLIDYVRQFVIVKNYLVKLFLLRADEVIELFSVFALKNDL